MSERAYGLIGLIGAIVAVILAIASIWDLARLKAAPYPKASFVWGAQVDVIKNEDAGYPYLTTTNPPMLLEGGWYRLSIYAKGPELPANNILECWKQCVETHSGGAK